VTTRDTPRRRKQIQAPVVNDDLSLLWMVNMGCIDLNTWYSRIDKPERPDWVLFDLDPSPDVGFAETVQVALLVRQALDALGLVSFAKTSGKKGLHVLVPIRPGPDTDEVRDFAERMGHLLARAHPTELTMEFSIARRKGRVYLDPGRNGFTQSVAAPWCVRRVPGAVVSTPLDWAEVKPTFDPTRFTMTTIARRVARPDPWRDFFRRRQALGPALAAVARL